MNRRDLYDEARISALSGNSIRQSEQEQGKSAALCRLSAEFRVACATRRFWFSADGSHILDSARRICGGKHLLDTIPP
jgi:hypothetical protein